MNEKRLISILLLGSFLWTTSVTAQAFKYAWPDTNFDLTSIDLGEIMSGGPPKDGIPPVDQPLFDSVEQAKAWIAPLEPVISVVIKDVAKAYPLQILTWHEIVNDELSGVPICVTFCPLCNASIVFDRRMDGVVLDFGTTGLLRMSDLVMYDRQTESWWQQFIGAAIVGDQVGNVLNRVPSAILSFESFSQAYPEGSVLNRDTGLRRPYGQNPYPGYDNINASPFLFRGKTDDRVPAMERVLGISYEGQHKIYPFAEFTQNPLIQDKVVDVDVLIVASGKLLSALDSRKIAESRTVPEVTAWRRHYAGSDETLDFQLIDGELIDKGSGSSWNAMGTAVSGPLAGKQLEPIENGIHFAFAWLAFNPETVIYKGNP